MTAKREIKLFREIALPGGLAALVDAEDYLRVSDRLWAVIECRGGFYYVFHNWRDGMGSDAPVRKTYLHREVMRAPLGWQVRFMTPNRLDCRKSNLCLVAPRCAP